MIVALDPGKTTGFAYRNGESGGAGEIAQDSVWDTLETLKPTILVVESFQFRQARSKVNLIPNEIIGVVKEWARQRNVPVVWQTPSQAKHYFDDRRLREIGAWAEGMPHARDATRHLLFYLQFGEGKATTGPAGSLSKPASLPENDEDGSREP